MIYVYKSEKENLSQEAVPEDSPADFVQSVCCPAVCLGRVFDGLQSDPELRGVSPGSCPPALLHHGVLPVDVGRGCPALPPTGQGAQSRRNYI